MWSWAGGQERPGLQRRSLHCPGAGGVSQPGAGTASPARGQYGGGISGSIEEAPRAGSRVGQGTRGHQRGPASPSPAATPVQR